MLLYYITARTEFAGDAAGQRRCLLKKIADAAHCGVDYIQLRENDLTGGALQSLAQEAVHTVRENCRKTAAGELCTRLLINSRTDVALSVGADGVHLRAQDVSVRELQKIWSTGKSASRGKPAVFPAVSVSCHSDADVARAAAEHADLAVLAPVFEKRALPAVAPAGLEALRRACRYNVPVLALGGVTLETIPACLNSGAAGIAAIRLFQENDIEKVVLRLRA